MKARSALAEVVRRSGKSAAEVSRAMGRTDTFVAATMRRGSVPKLDTFCAICEASGGEVVVRFADGEEVVVEAD